MTRRDAAIVAGIAAALVLTRSYWLSPRAPTWLRGASPFTWTTTRAERDRCLTFARMIGSTHPSTYYYGENLAAKPEFTIERTARSGDSLVFDGRVERNRRVDYVFHCATANVHGRPGEHRSELAEPWGDAEHWPAVDAIEDRFRNECIDSLTAHHPNSVFSRKTLMLRRIPGRGVLMVNALDTTLADGSQSFACSVEQGVRGSGDFIHPLDDATAR